MTDQRNSYQRKTINSCLLLLMNIINIHLVGIWHYLQKASEFFCTYLFARTLSEKLDDFLVRHSELSQGDVDIQTPFSLQQIDLINMQRKILVIAKKKRSKIFSLFFHLLTISDIYNASSIRITKINLLISLSA